MTATAQIDAASWPRGAGRTDLLIVAGSLAVGVLFGQLFRWTQPPVDPRVSMPDIAAHNLFLAVLGVAGTHYLARPMIALSALWLGMGLSASVATSGAARTAMLSLPHMPIEVAAWLVTLRLAGLAWPWLIARLRHPGAPRERGVRLVRLALLATGLYLIAALSEWAEVAVGWAR